jgi:phosphoribosylaminoimidazolecarboxamide formyltransferase / IMP cyclohydrolase
MKLKYGMNPYQDKAEITDPNNALQLINGTPSVINVLDALNSWQLVKELNASFGKESAASFKHVTPSGVALATGLTAQEKDAYLIKNETSKLASAYARARGADRLASFGDFIALSHTVDSATAKLIRSEVSDGLIAPGFEDAALEILRKKKGGKYVIFKIDPSYVPPEMESRELFGITVSQKRNNFSITKECFSEVVTENKNLSESIQDNLILGLITLKYTQSNSLCLVSGGQVIGIGSGQQSRILCSQLAISKAMNWYKKLSMDYSFLKDYPSLKRTELDQLIELERQKSNTGPKSLKALQDTCLISDGFFPQKDNIELASQFGIKTIAAPMGSVRDEEIIECANKHGITFIDTKLRLFHH